MWYEMIEFPLPRGLVGTLFWTLGANEKKVQFPLTNQKKKGHVMILSRIHTAQLPI